MALKDLTLIEPYSLTSEQCPIFVSSGDMKSFFGWGIRKRTKSWFNHVMIIRVPGMLVSQSKTYEEFDIGRYMKPGQIMKFWRCKDITEQEKNAIMIKIAFELNQPWYKKLYDMPGIIGQLFGMRWFNIPWLNYCSERISSKVRCIIPKISKHSTPEDIEVLFKESDRMEIIGYWVGI